MSVLRTLEREFDWRLTDLRWPVTTQVGRGLGGVIAATTRVSWLDPVRGRLSYRGVALESLAGSTTFEDVTFLLVTGARPETDTSALSAFRRHLRASRDLPPDVVSLLGDLDPATHPTRMLRAGISALGCHELTAHDDLSGDRHWRELRIVGQTASLVAEVARLRRGCARIDSGPAISLAESVLTALTDRPPDDDDVAALDLLWVLYAVHGLDAPTFTSMVVASCLADPYANVVAGLSALRGPRQGGASEDVLAQLASLDGPAAAPGWVADALQRGEAIAGFGHRRYRTPDPRVPILRRAAVEVACKRGRGRLVETAIAVEEAAASILGTKGVCVNINFYAAVLFHLLGADPPLVPCLIAVGRTAGMVALVRESLDTIRIYRPLCRYRGTGPRSVHGAEGP